MLYVILGITAGYTGSFVKLKMGEENVTKN